MSAREEDKVKLYFLAIVPPSPVYDDALRFKNYFKDQYNSKASSNSPPHVTLHMPFQWKEKKEENLIQNLSTFAKGRSAFKMHLNNFGSFPPRVIFIDVVLSEGLITLKKELTRFCKQHLNLFNADYKDQSFHPHMTLAFRDLKKPMFERAWNEFQQRTFTASFEVNQVTLLKHNGKTWDILKALTFEEVPAEDIIRPSDQMYP